MHKMTIRKFQLILLTTLLFQSEIWSQTSVKLQQPPPYQFRVEQFWKVVIVNNGRSAVNIFLKGTATESAKGKIIEATSSAITVQPGLKIVTGRELGPFSVNQSNDQHKNIMMNTGSVPSGNYNICITAYDAAGGKQISSDCIFVSIENFNRMELISPFDGEVIGVIPEGAKNTLNSGSINRSPSVIFSWLPPIPIPNNANISYRLKLVELLGNQSVNAAMASNPIYFQSPIISATVLRYPIAAQQLMPGRKYAWAVEVFVNNYRTQESEIRSFEVAGGEALNSDRRTSNLSQRKYSQTERGSYSMLPSGLSLSSLKGHEEQHAINFNSLQQSRFTSSQNDFKFYGDAKLTQVTTKRVPQYSQLPKSYWTLEINPRTSIYDIPFGLNIYLTSLNNESVQSLNTFSFNLDIDRMKTKISERISEKIGQIQNSMELSPEKLKEIESLTDPLEINDRIAKKIREIQSSVDSSLGKAMEAELIAEKIREIQTSTDAPLEKLKKIELLSEPTYLDKIREVELLNDPTKIAENAERLGLISSTEKFFMNIKSFGIGRTYPEYSDLTVSGVPVNGLNIEYNPGIFYFASAFWNNLEGINNVSFKRSFFAGRFGFGKKDETHMFFTLLKMKDDEKSISDISSSLLTPQENEVIDAEGKISLFDNLLTLKSEAAISLFTRDIRDSEIQDNSLPGFVKNIYNPKISTSYDYALHGIAIFDQPKNDTYFSLEVNRIGPGYISLAAPNIRSDQLMFESKLNKKFSDKKIGMKTFVKIYQDNIINWKSTTTTTASLGISIDFNFPDVPFISIGYSPYFQGNVTTTVIQTIKNDNHIVTLMTGHSYQLSNMYASTVFSFNGQWQNAKVGNVSNKFSNLSYILNQNIGFEIPLALSATISLVQSKLISISSNITELDLNGSYQFNETISANLGTTFSNEEHYTKRIIVYMGSNIILADWLRFELQGSISNYKDLTGGPNSYDDGMFRASINVKW